MLRFLNEGNNPGSDGFPCWGVILASELEGPSKSSNRLGGIQASAGRTQASEDPNGLGGTRASNSLPGLDNVAFR